MGARGAVDRRVLGDRAPARIDGERDAARARRPATRRTDQALVRRHARGRLTLVGDADDHALPVVAVKALQGGDRSVQRLRIRVVEPVLDERHTLIIATPRRSARLPHQMREDRRAAGAKRRAPRLAADAGIRWHRRVLAVAIALEDHRRDVAADQWAVRIAAQGPAIIAALRAMPRD